MKQELVNKLREIQNDIRLVKRDKEGKEKAFRLMEISYENGFYIGLRFFGLPKLFLIPSESFPPSTKRSNDKIIGLDLFLSGKEVYFNMEDSFLRIKKEK